MNNLELSTLVNNASDFGTIYNRLRERTDKPLEIAIYAWTVIKSQSEYSIPSQVVFETSVAELQRRTTSMEVSVNAVRGI